MQAAEDAATERKKRLNEAEAAKVAKAAKAAKAAAVAAVAERTRLVEKAKAAAVAAAAEQTRLVEKAKVDDAAAQAAAKRIVDAEAAKEIAAATAMQKRTDDEAEAAEPAFDEPASDEPADESAAEIEELQARLAAMQPEAQMPPGSAPSKAMQIAEPAAVPTRRISPRTGKRMREHQAGQEGKIRELTKQLTDKGKELEGATIKIEKLEAKLIVKERQRSAATARGE